MAVAVATYYSSVKIEDTIILYFSEAIIIINVFSKLAILNRKKWVPRAP